MATSLHSRLTSVEANIEKVYGLIQRLQSFGSSESPDDDGRINISTDIHQALGEIEEEMEILRVETHPLERRRHQRRESAQVGPAGGQSMVLMAKLEEDLKITRSKFRRAQIEAKRNSEIAKNRQRQLLFQPAMDGGDGPKRRSPRFTHGDIVANSSKDVTAALRQTHHLMQSELSRSQFAQETLEQSTKALGSLSESYSNLDTLLASSRSLVGSLLRSQKSDTWYLETAFYILIGTISWLIFRRILYGPLWWLLWLPLKLFAKLTFAILGVSGGVSQGISGNIKSISSSTQSLPTASLGPTVTNSLWNPKSTDTASIPDMAEDVNRWIETGQEGGSLVSTDKDNHQPTQLPDGPKVFPNPNKRMWEEPVVDEL
ncbi:Sec20 domain-containing protein [Arthroderma uncinatum]|uniref:Sec20 domain-containing protein n=1 Tax=Arthroderma uncinatum TaxID=74035 RepID=UPI00144A5B8F|nr:Sec20 domain-containing protein [Arthroderma uncinatum]KAF3481585.1 Sec20 domain-containing protein [Arthroderma uncinatum]